MQIIHHNTETVAAFNKTASLKRNAILFCAINQGQAGRCSTATQNENV